MPARNRLVRLRRASQIFFFLVFTLLLAGTGFRAASGSADDIQMRWPVRRIFEFDPLAAVVNALATHALYRGLLWSLLILIPVLFLGRFFCGWICPMGSLHHFFGYLRSEHKCGRQWIESNRYRRWQRAKYAILLAILAAALCGSAIGGWLDPLSLLVRSLSVSILPGLQYAANAILTPLEHSRIPALQQSAAVLHAILGATVLNLRQPHFRQGVWVGLILVLLVVLNLRITRFWCRALCPLGALLGVAARWSILGLHKDAAACDNCNRCLLHCQGGDDPIGTAPWHKAECHLCLNCVDACPHGSLQFRFFRREAEIAGPNLPRRRAIAGLAAGAALVPLLRAETPLGRGRNEHLIRPPGALEESEFLSRCIRCGECMKVCPNNSLQPALEEGGLEGLWTPVLVPRTGYCEPSCVLCSEACPTGAIWTITSREKGWVVGAGEDAQPVRLGTAFHDRSRCLPWALATDCVVCEEWCPVSPKAIYLDQAEMIDADGHQKLVKQPHVDPGRCVGCGACEYACPLQERPAVYVTSIGESRSAANQILLTRRSAANQILLTRRKERAQS